MPGLNIHSAVTDPEILSMFQDISAVNYLSKEELAAREEMMKAGAE